VKPNIEILDGDLLMFGNGLGSRRNKLIDAVRSGEHPDSKKEGCLFVNP
jgi:hypothetical protein